jgi:hypothetical protein
MSFTAFHAHYLLLIFKLVINEVRLAMHHHPAALFKLRGHYSSD